MLKGINERTKYCIIQLLKLSTLRSLFTKSIIAALVQLIQSDNQKSRSLDLITAVTKDS
jgi:hypothetical protein